MANITVDLSQFQAGMKRLDKVMQKAQWAGILDVSNEVLRLSQREVPHDTGRLQNSGHIEPTYMKYAKVGYNTVYAARLHEHPEYRFNKGRKGKYLEDPIKNNLHVFRQYFSDKIREALR